MAVADLLSISCFCFRIHIGGGYIMADATASTSAGSSSTKGVSGDLANCQVVLTDFTKASSSLNDLVAQQSVEQPLNGNSN